MSERRTCGIHGDDTSSGRCATCERQARALAEAEALVRADQAGTTPQDLAVLADKAVRMAGGMREHLAASRLIDAWAAADWLGDLAQEVKDRLPVKAKDIVAAVEAAAGRAGVVPGGIGGRGAQVVAPGTDAEERARSRDEGR